MGSNPTDVKQFFFFASCGPYFLTKANAQEEVYGLFLAFKLIIFCIICITCAS